MAAKSQQSSAQYRRASGDQGLAARRHVRAVCLASKSVNLRESPLVSRSSPGCRAPRPRARLWPGAITACPPLGALILHRLSFLLVAIALALPLAGGGVDAATGGPPAVLGQVGLPPPARGGAIVEENQRPGTTAWQSAALAWEAAARGPALRDERPRPGWPG